MENTEDPKPTETQTEEPVVDKTPVEKVEDNYEKLKSANDKVEAELLRGEQLKAKIALGGGTDAGQTKPEPVPETDREYAEKAIRGDLNDAE